MSTAPSSADVYKKRFDERDRERKRRLWRVLCQGFFQDYIRPNDVVVDIGAGYCEFVNNIACSKRIAVDINPETERCASPEVEVVITDCTDLPVIEDSSVNVVFISNLLEHLPDKLSVLQTLQEAHRILRRGGLILILQPNIRAIGDAYWDFIDHHIPLTDRTVVEALNLVGIRVRVVKARFLPYTTKSRIPQWPILVKLYLRMPLMHRVFGQQAWIVGEKL